jgi:hypothetical protein
VDNPNWVDNAGHAVPIELPFIPPSFGASGRLPGQTCVEFTSANTSFLNTQIASSSYWKGYQSNEFTTSFWVKFKTLGSVEVIFSNYGGVPPYFNIFKQSDDTINFSLVLPNNTSITCKTYSTVSTGVWYHLAFVNRPYADVRRMQIYIDGVQQPLNPISNNATGSDLLSSSAPFGIGANYNNTQHLDGFLEDLRFYERSLTTEQIQEIYNDTLVTPYSTDQSFGELPIHQHKLNEPVGSTVAYDSLPKWTKLYNDNKIEGTFKHEQINNNWVKITAENILLPDTMHWEQGFETCIVLPKDCMVGTHDVLFTGVHMNEGGKDTGFVPKSEEYNIEKVQRFYKKYFKEITSLTFSVSDITAFLSTYKGKSSLNMIKEPSVSTSGSDNYDGWYEVDSTIIG